MRISDWSSDVCSSDLLPPVRDKRMFDDAAPDQPSAVGSVLYRHHFPVVVELTTVYRQLDRGFRELLNNVRDGSTTAEDVALLRMRVLDRLPPGGDLDGRGTFPRLYTMKHRVDRFNNQKLAEDDRKRTRLNYRH